MKKFLIKVNGNQYEVEVEEVISAGHAEKPVQNTKESSAPAPVPVSAPTAAPSPVQAQKPSQVKSDHASSGGKHEITAPMPGTILKVNVSSGDMVKKGQVLLILEAMKMENEIVSPIDGKIASINVEKGKAVGVGEMMISIA